MNTINLKLEVFKKFNQAKRIEEYEEKMYLSNSDFVNILMEFKFKKIKVD